ncbi:MAG: hypothetical protein OHK0038_25120 [Flammeovirgaceae bacterium]
MRKLFKLLFFRVFLVVSAVVIANSACQEDKQLGADLLPNVGIDNTLYSDTFTIESSVVQLDSVNTSYGNLLVGSIHHEGIGKTTSDAYLDFYYYDLYSSEYPNNITSFDSISLSFRYLDIYGNKEKSLNLSVWELDDTIKYTQYSFQTIPTKKLLSNYTFSPKNTTALEDTFEIKLPYELGSKIFNARNDTTIKTQTIFNSKVFKGLKLQCDNQEDISIANISISYVFLKMYYTVTDTSGSKARHKSMGIFRKFSNIRLEKEGELVKLPNNMPINTEQLNNLAFIHAGVGIVTELKFPSLKNMEKGDFHVLVNRAELIIEPHKLYSLNEKVPPKNIYLVLSDNQGKPLKHNEDTLYHLRSEPIHQSSGNIVNPPLPYFFEYTLKGQSTVQSAISRIVYNAAASNYYSYYSNWITTYVQNVIDGNETHGIVLLPDYPGYNLSLPDQSTYYSNVHPLIFSNQKGQSFPMKLRVYYTKIPK